MLKVLAQAHPDKRLEVWFEDEARFGQQGTLTWVWARRGSRPRAVKQTCYDWLYVIGAVCPQTGQSVGVRYMAFSLRMLHLDRASFRSA